MAPEFRYSLTRICLRTGQLSLSRRMSEIFPESGVVRALDTLDDREFELRIGEQRKVSGLAAFFDRHRLDVNDQIQIRPAGEGAVALTAMPRRKSRRLDEAAVNELLDSLVGDRPRTEAEIRALNPQIPADYPLSEALEAHPRLRQRGGRWVGEAEAPGVDGTAELRRGDPPEVGPEVRPEPGESPGEARSPAVADHRAAAGSIETVREENEAAPESPSQAYAGTAGAEGGEEDSGRQDPFQSAGARWSERWSEWPGTGEEGGTASGSGAVSGREAPTDREQRAEREPPGERREGAERDARVDRRSRSGGGSPAQPEGGSTAQPRGDAERESRPEREGRRQRDRTQPGRPAAVTPYPRGVLFPGEAALNSQRPAGDLSHVNRAREALSGFGYRVEGLPHGMLLAKADLGRRKHSVLVRVLADGERLDWAALLARRREQTADYLAVVGDHRDLHRLTAPAELARATLWSWDGIARVQSLSQAILIGPFDLEPHFAKDGMSGNGLQQFERTVGRMIAEKGVLSAVIARLGALRAPAVFVLDDLVEDDLQREQVAKALELLAQAPFHLVARIDRGEYCLRHTVAQSLAHLSEYAISLGERLPGGGNRRARVGAYARPESDAVRDERERTGDRSAEGWDLELAEDG